MPKLSELLLAVTLIVSASASWSQSKLELAQEYNALPAVQQMMVEMFSPQASAAQFKASLPPGVQVTQAQAAEVGVVMSSVLMGLKPRMEELQTIAISEVFSAEEIQAMIDFHSTDVGAAILIKTQPMFQKVMGDLAPEIIQAMGAKQGEIAEIMTQ